MTFLHRRRHCCPLFFNSSVFIQAVTTAGVLALGTPAFSATAQFFDDPETIQVHYFADGRVGFAKSGPYLGPLKGETCAKLARKDMKHDRVEPVCKRKPPSGSTPQVPLYARPVPGPTGTFIAGYSLSAGTWQAGHADAAWGYGDSYYAASDYQTQYVFTQYVSYFAETTTINIEGCGCKPPPVEPPIVPLPASALLLLSALFLLRKIS